MTRFNVTPKEAVAIQKKLREQIELVPLKKPIRSIAGCDVSLNIFAKDGFGGFVVMTYPDLAPLGRSIVHESIPFPYIPGLLSFREIPMLKIAWKKLKKKPDLIIVDGVGYAHPRRMGIATHLGLELGVPTIGCAKSVLVGTYKEPAQRVGAHTALIDPKTGEVLGAALRTKPGVKPVFISAGHRITLEESLTIMRSLIRKHRLPEPTRLAHLAVNEYRIQNNDVSRH